MSEQQSIRDDIARALSVAYDLTSGMAIVDTPESVADALLSSAVIRRIQAEAWDGGHKWKRRRGSDECHCHAYSSSECACGKFGTGTLESLTDNPHRPKKGGS